MPIVTERGFGPDGWATVADETAVADSGDVIVSWKRFVAEAATLTGRAGRIGVAVGPDFDVDLHVAGLDGVALVAIAFAKFADGRGFSIARRLRDRGFAGTIRAVGPLIAEQAPMAFACGIDEIAIPDDLAARQPESRWLRAVELRAAVSYQRGYRTGASVFDQRSTGGAA